MIWTTTGNLTNVKNNAKFDFGVAMLPANKRRGSPTGGGNFYVFKKATKEQQAAAVKFAKWMTTPERAAQWGIDTGYVAVRPDASADAVLLPARLFADVQGTSSLKLFSLELPTRVGLPALASVGASGKQAVAQASKLSGRPAQLLGIDSWQ